VLAAALLDSSAPRTGSTSAAIGSSQKQASAQAGRFAALPAREAIGKPRGEPFGQRSWAPAAPPPSAVAAAAPKPVAPPVPYRVAGQVTRDGVVQVVLARDDRVISVREGDRLDDEYRVESIKPDAVTLVYLPLDTRQDLPVAGMQLEPQRAATVAAANTPASPAVTAPSEPRAAQLRFEGPQRVQAGSNFDVALKLTSGEPVSALPLQLSFDAKLLEPVAVRPGGFFADGKFTYRVSKGGSIFVGASGNGAVATDVDFLVVTFRPIRSGAAEIKLSSAALQGPAGRAIAHEAPAAFRTSIIQ
jgi:hypothetical protein